MSVCANCHGTEGPFTKTWKERGIVIATFPPICKPTKEHPDRISECVQRRDRYDADKYKEQLDIYA